MSSHILSLLKNYGLETKEAEIYTALLRKVEVSAYTLSKETGIPRTTIYEVLERLEEQGLVSSSKRNGRLRYTAESPNRFSNLLKEKEDVIKQLIPALFAMSKNKTVAPMIKFFTGSSGTIRALEDIIETYEKTDSKQMYAIAGSDLHYRKYNILKKWIAKREKLGVHIKFITYESDTDIYKTAYRTSKWRETRTIPSKFLFDSTVDLYAGKVAIFSEVDGEEYAIIIESPAIYETFLKFHDFMWEHATKVK